MVANRAKHHIINMIVLQEELPIILIVEITLETQIKGHQTIKTYGQQSWVNTLEVQCKPQNVVDKYAVCF